MCSFYRGFQNSDSFRPTCTTRDYLPGINQEKSSENININVFLISKPPRAPTPAGVFFVGCSRNYCSFLWHDSLENTEVLFSLSFGRAPLQVIRSAEHVSKNMRAPARPGFPTELCLR